MLWGDFNRYNRNGRYVEHLQDVTEQGDIMQKALKYRRYNDIIISI